MFWSTMSIFGSSSNNNNINNNNEINTFWSGLAHCFIATTTDVCKQKLAKCFLYSSNNPLTRPTHTPASHTHTHTGRQLDPASCPPTTFIILYPNPKLSLEPSFHAQPDTINSCYTLLMIHVCDTVIGWNILRTNSIEHKKFLLKNLKKCVNQ